MLATLLRHSLSIQIQEKTNRESKIKRVEAQLSSLQLQTSPHFLLNTLNNIYALVELDPRKVKKAIQDGDIILCHDIKDNAPTSTARVVEYLEENGYMLLTIDELFAKDGVELQPDTVYYRCVDGDTSKRSDT